VTRVILGEKPDPINGGWCMPCMGWSSNV
jgi:hypothetical protein